jgi:hypothetical protein
LALRLALETKLVYIVSGWMRREEKRGEERRGEDKRLSSLNKITGLRL